MKENNKKLNECSEYFHVDGDANKDSYRIAMGESVGNKSIIYHFVDEKKIINILNQNEIKPRWKHYIETEDKVVVGTSFTWDEKHSTIQNMEYPIKLVFDRNKIENDFKTFLINSTRVHLQTMAMLKPNLYDPTAYTFESEEPNELFVEGVIKPLNEYLIDVILLKDVSNETKTLINAYKPNFMNNKKTNINEDVNPEELPSEDMVNYMHNPEYSHSFEDFHETFHFELAGLSFIKSYSVFEKAKTNADLRESVEPEEVDLSSFQNKKKLNTYFFDENQQLKPKVRKRLLEIANDFYEFLETPWLKVEDIVFMGSLTNFNWSEHSDVDLHLVYDPSEVKDNLKITEEYFKLKKWAWSDKHENLNIYGYPIELYVQPSTQEEKEDDSAYSVQDDEWLQKPSYQVEPFDKEKVKQKASELMNKIDEFYEIYAKNDKPEELKYLLRDVEKLWDRIKNSRSIGLDREGIFSFENIVFKVLRRTKYMEKITELKNLIYDKQNSLNENKTKVEEDIILPVEKGDTILTGKFKNKKTVVKDIDKDIHGMPTINGKQATTFRTTKQIKEAFGIKEEKSEEELTTLYHGSKYLFDKFDMNKINTGQHSQDFGYGLYFTSNKETAKFYTNELSNTKTPIEKYNEIILTNDKNEILYNYLEENRLVSAKRILNELISDAVGDVNEWKELLESLDKVQRYGYLYTVNINNGDFISKEDYLMLKNKLNITDKEMNLVLLKDGYNGIKYKINSFGLNKTTDFNQEYNVVIIDETIITIKDVEKVDFEGVLKLDHVNESKDTKDKDIKTTIQNLKKLPQELKDFAKEHANPAPYTKAKSGKVSELNTPTEFKKKLEAEGLPTGFSVGVDKDGYYIHTHRARSKSYESLDKIPKKDIRFIDSTG